MHVPPSGGRGAAGSVFNGQLSHAISVLRAPPVTAALLGRTVASATLRIAEIFTPTVNPGIPVVQAYQVGAGDGIRAYPQLMIGLGPCTGPCSFIVSSKQRGPGFVTLPDSEKFVDPSGSMKVEVARHGVGNKVTLTNLKPNAFRMMFRVNGKDGLVESSILQGSQSFDASRVDSVQVVLVDKGSYPFQFEQGFYLADIALNLPKVAVRPEVPDMDSGVDSHARVYVRAADLDLMGVVGGRHMPNPRVPARVTPVKATAVPAIRDRGRIAVVATVSHLAVAAGRLVVAAWRRFFPQPLKGAIHQATKYAFKGSPPLEVNLDSVDWTKTKELESSLTVTVRRADKGRKRQTVATETGAEIQVPSFDNRFSRSGTIALELHREGTGVTNLEKVPLRLSYEGFVYKTLEPSQAVSLPLQNRRITVERMGESGWERLVDFFLPDRDTNPVAEGCQTAAIHSDDWGAK